MALPYRPEDPPLHRSLRRQYDRSIGISERLLLGDGLGDQGEPNGGGRPASTCSKVAFPVPQMPVTRLAGSVAIRITRSAHRVGSASR